MSYYNNLEIRDFLKKDIDQSSVNEGVIIKALESCYNNCAFSTFPYIMHGIDSKESIHRFNSGNCVALSIYLKEYLGNNFNIHSYLIPATIPNKYKFPGYLDISHVVLAIPKNNNEIYIADPAFYFLNPIKVNMNDMSSTIIFSKEIYTEENNNNLIDYNSIKTITAKTKIIDKTTKFNPYQTIPKNTIISEVHYTGDPKDKWIYFLKEIINPDRAISDFFIGIRTDPFIMTTIMDKNGICKGNGYFSLNSNGSVKISEKDKDRDFYHINTIPLNKLETVRNFTNPYFGGNFDNYIDIYRDKVNSI